MRLFEGKTVGGATEILDADRRREHPFDSEPAVVARTYDDGTKQLLLAAAKTKASREALLAACRAVVHATDHQPANTLITALSGAADQCRKAVKAAEAK